jgi:cell division protein FtsQ
VTRHTPRPTRRDPAPSRLRYRLNRLWLRPAFRRMVNFGVPALAAALAAWTLAAELELKARAGAALAALRETVIDRPQFLITELSIPDVSPDLAEQIREASFVALPVNSLEVDVAAVRDRVEALDAVERARVRALADGVLEIRAIERIPVVVWRSDDGLQLLDQTGVRVAEIDSRLRRPDLPLLVGAGANAEVPEALEILAAARPLLPRLRGLVRMGERRWDLALDRGQLVRLPEADPLAALDRVMALDASEQLLSRDVSVVDLRDPSRATVRLNEHAIAELERLRTGEKGEDI